MSTPLSSLSFFRTDCLDNRRAWDHVVAFHLRFQRALPAHGAPPRPPPISSARNLPETTLGPGIGCYIAETGTGWRINSLVKTSRLLPISQAAVAQRQQAVRTNVRTAIVARAKEAGCGIMGTKAGMTTVFTEDGLALACTVLALEDGNVVTQVRLNINPSAARQWQPRPRARAKNRLWLLGPEGQRRPPPNFSLAHPRCPSPNPPMPPSIHAGQDH